MLDRSSSVNVALAFASSPKALHTHTHSLDPIRHRIDSTLSIPDADKLEASIYCDQGRQPAHTSL